MPIYEYVCSECGTKFEKLVRLTNAQREITCPHCGSLNVEKSFSVFGVSGGTGPGSASSASSCSPTGG